MRLVRLGVVASGLWIMTGCPLIDTDYAGPDTDPLTECEPGEQSCVDTDFDTYIECDTDGTWNDTDELQISGCIQGLTACMVMEGLAMCM